jgi:epoxide hydrolase
MWVPKERGTVPTAVAVFTTDVTVRRFADQVHHVARWSEFDRGGHFAALDARCAPGRNGARVAIMAG